MSPDRLDRDIRGIAKRGLSSAKFRRECGARIVAGLGADAYCFAEIDPDSLHATTYATGGLDRSGASLLHLNEYGQLDFLKLAELVGAPSAAGSLLDATGGCIEQSRRYRDLLRPLGMGHEMRAVARTEGRAWGFLHLYRRHSRAPFTPAEVRLAHRLSPILAAGIRDGVLSPSAASPPPSHDPMLVIVDADDRIAESTPEAIMVLEELRDADEPASQTPEIAITMAAAARARAMQPTAAARRSPTARMRARSGRWISLSAAVTKADSAEGRVALILQATNPPPTSELWRARYGLSSGETEVVEKMLAGHSTTQIAAELIISTWTVQDRFTSVFAKTGVRSRRELSALLRPCP